MKLLIITQAVDVEDSVLGFFVRWIEELSKRTESIEIVCLKEGMHNLPANVRVHSLGKEKAVSRTKYVLNFYKYIWLLRHDYYSVFVHMNQEYVLLGGWWWRLIGKKVLLWRNHARGDLFTRLAVLLSNKVFYTSSQSFTARYKKSLQMPVGIDTDFFKPDPLVSKKPNSILFLGRIAPVKKVEEFVEALLELKKIGIEFSATIAGASLPKDVEYEKAIRERVSTCGLDDKVRFIGSVTQNQARPLYCEHELYVNLTPSGSMDKTILEAMACGTTPLVFNQDLKKVLGAELLVPKLDVADIAKRIGSVLRDGRENDWRSFVVENHSLKMLAYKLMREL